MTVEIEDSTNAVVSGDNSTQITLAIGTNPASGTLSGTLPVTVVNGVATFSDLSIDNAGTGYTLTAADMTDGTVTSDTSNPFDILQKVDHLAFVQQPSDAIAGMVNTPAVTVEVEDASNARVTTDNTTQITMAIGTNPASGTLSGTLTVTVSNGLATFTDLSIDKAGTGYTLSTSALTFTNVGSNPFNITPAVPAQLAFLQ